MVNPLKNKWLAAGLAGALVLGLTGAATAFAATTDVPRGVSVLGIEIGGKSRADAADALRKGLAGRDEVTKPIAIKIGDKTASVEPEDIGLAVDVDATIADATGGWPNPISALAGLFGTTTDVNPVIVVDPQRLDEVLKPTAAQAGKAPTMPGVKFDGLVAKPVYPAAGRGLDAGKSAQALKDSWLRSDEIDVPLVDVNPVSTAAEVDAMIADLAAKAVAAPVTISTSKGKLTASPKEIAASLVIDADSAGKLNPHVDETKLRSALKSQLDKVEIKPKNATIATDGTTPKVLASSGGSLVDTAALATAMLPVLSKPADRTVQASIKNISPITTTGDLAKLGIKEQVSTFTTYFNGGLTSGRSKNIVQAAKKVDGTIVKPGETFSLNGHTGPRGYAEGYHDAPVVLDGKLQPGVGGGVSQFTTTLFNAAYYAGLEDVEHKPHSYYFSRYPTVIEATIWFPYLDMKFRNNTEYGVLIDTSYTNDSLTISMWSTKIYDSVTTEWEKKRDITQPKKVVLPASPTCMVTEGAQGFAQDAWRIFRKDGKEVKREKFSWRYDASPRQVCGDEKKSP